MSVHEKLAFIPTKSSLAKQKKAEEFKAIVFESHKPKEKKALQKPEKGVRINSKSNEINIEKARHEIIKFGMSGFDPEKKEQAKVQLAISLGAKPPKNKYKNYKLLKEEKKIELSLAKQRLEFQQLGKKLSGKSNAKGKSFDRKRRKDKGGLLDQYGKVSPNKRT